jgi:hypothetical protein
VVYCELGVPRSRVACSKAPPLQARLRANKLTHFLLEAEADCEGEAVQLRTARLAQYTASVLRAQQYRPPTDTALVDSLYGVLVCCSESVLHSWAIELGY